MYTKWFYIDKPVWNNKFSFEKRKNKKLFVTNIKNINNFDEIELWNEIVFEDYDFEWKLSSNRGLKNFYRIKWKQKEIIIFDNHNHAFYFWYEARKKWIIWDNNILFHIDEHSDLKDNNKVLLKKDSSDLEKVFNFTNYELNVGDYIIPALNEWIIWEVVQIRNEINLNDYNNTSPPTSFLPKFGTGRWEGSNWIILNLDMDFFRPELDDIDYELKKKVVLDIAEKASIITVATSPFFINQELAVNIIKFFYI